MLSHRLGPISQLAYVVDDLRESARFWAETLSVGPFFLLEHCKFVSLEVRGEPSEADFSLAIAWSGNVQIELIEQHNTAPSVFTLYRPDQRNGLHHVGIVSRDLESDEEHLSAQGLSRVQAGLSTRGTETVFLRGERPGVLVELIKSGDGGRFSSLLKQAAATWDGKSPFVETLE
ncbi:VOC family protein [Agrobacterium sp. LAD9]|uniref:VOC family protein n=1 Tax=Agrobacterium sp. LAD9 TaxID=2055153 RepID=UPI000D1E2CC4|nr:VOC family protein [Agrobacterium sp. LAD9]